MTKRGGDAADRPLAGLTLMELWQLFPIILKPHNPAYTSWYAAEKTHLTSSIGQMISRLSHIGSTAVPGLLAKPTIDVLLEVAPGADPAELAASLDRQDWLLMSGSPTDHPFDHLVFNKGYTPQGFSDRVFHLHVRALGDWGEPYFRDYLINNSPMADAYAELKLSLLGRYKHDRDAYTEAKTSFITAVTAKARVKYPGRYRPPA